VQHCALLCTALHHCQIIAKHSAPENRLMGAGSGRLREQAEKPAELQEG